MPDPATRDGDFIELVAASWSRLVRSAILMGCEPHEAEDVVQAALVKCFVSWRRVRMAEDRDAYVYRIMMNCLKSARRKRSASEIPFDHTASTSLEQYKSTDEIDTATVLKSALSELTNEARQVIVLRYFADLSEIQISEVLRVPGGTVKSRLSRAITSLGENQQLLDLRN